MSSISRKTSRICLLGVEIDNVGFYEALEIICELASNKDAASFVVTPNVDHVITLQHDMLFQRIYRHADLALPDGVPLLWAAKCQGTPLKERVTGADLFPALCRVACQKGYRLFFLGGMPGVAEKAKKILESRYPGIMIAGVYSPPFGFENDKTEISKICTMIVEAKPHILFVGLGAPKQEKFIYRFRETLGVPVSIGVGAAFDFIACTKKRAPRWMQRIGLEWLFRVLMEPRRLFKRYFIRDARFFMLVYLEKRKRKRTTAT